jgi:carboxypeptidase T
MTIRPHPTRRSWTILSLTLVLMLLVGSKIALGHTRPSPSASTDSATPPEPQAGVYRVYYDSQERLDILAVHFDIWHVEPEAGYAVLGLDASSAAALIAQGYLLELDGEQTTQQLLGPPGYPCYRDVGELYADLQQLAADYPDLTELVDYGDSWHKVTPGDEPGYDLWALKITNKHVPAQASKPRFFLMANIHARELTTPETAMYFVEHLLSNYGSDPDVTWIVDYHEIYVVVTANPDGLLIVENGCFQRKNGNDTRGSCRVCDPWGDDHYGVDLNRNNSYHWGGAGTFPCEQTYQGTSAASEPETYDLNDLVRTIFPDQRPDDDTSPAPDDATGLLISLHSYSNLVLWPWGWTHDAVPNQAQLQTLGRKFAYFNNYMPESSSALYMTTGDTTDWAYGELGIPAYTFELGETFFQSCSDLPQIREENLGALLYAAKVARTPYLTASGPDRERSLAVRWHR